MFDKGLVAAFMARLAQEASPPETQLVIRGHFKNTIYGGASIVELPYRYTSFANARTAKSIFQSLGEDILTVIRDAGGVISDEQYHAVTFVIDDARS